MDRRLAAILIALLAFAPALADEEEPAAEASAEEAEEKPAEDEEEKN